MKLAALLVVAACSSTASPGHAPVSNHATTPAPDAAVDSATLVNGRIIRFEKVGTETILTINKGSDDGIDRHWRAKLVLDNGASVVEVMLIRVDKTMSMLKTIGPVPVDVPRTTVRFEAPLDTVEE